MESTPHTVPDLLWVIASALAFVVTTVIPALFWQLVKSQRQARTDLVDNVQHLANTSAVIAKHSERLQRVESLVATEHLRSQKAINDHTTGEIGRLEARA